MRLLPGSQGLRFETPLASPFALPFVALCMALVVAENEQFASEVQMRQ